jgi:hypothetical protein
MLHPGVVVEPIPGEVFAVAGCTESSVWHLGHKRDVGVDPHASEVELACEAIGGSVVAGPDTGGQAERHTIRHGDLLRLVVPRHHLSDDTDGLPTDAGGVPFEVLARRLPLEHAGGASKEAQLIDALIDLFRCDVSDRLTGVACLKLA